MGSLHIRYAGLVAQSWAMFQFKRNFLAIRYLKKAFLIGAKEGYFHIPGWPFKIMNYLCEVALTEGIEPEYTQKLIRLHQMVPSEPLKAPVNWPWKIQIKLFGQFRLFIEGAEWLPSRKSQQRPLAILKLLAFNTNGIHQETLADILWADSDGDSVIQTLHTTLHRLRKLLGSHDVITLKNGVLRLNPKLVHVDVASFQLLCQEKLDRTETMFNYKEVGNYYSKGVLLGETESSWLIPIRDNIKAEFLNYLYRLGDSMEQRGDKSNSIRIYQQAISVNDCVERSYQRLIQLYVEEGLHAEAMQTYEQCSMALQLRYKISPSEKTKKLITNL
jgi:DNA-binding SARP family transcriptional activator